MIKRHIGGFSNFNSSYDWKPRCQVSFFDVFETYSRDENGFLQYSFELVDKQFICLDTKKDEPVSAGQYCEKRMRWLDSELSKTSKGG